MPDHQAGGVHAFGFGVLGVDAHVADVGVGEGDDLAGVGGIGEDLLITGHGGVEHHLADGDALGTDGFSVEHAAIGEGQQGWFAQGLLRAGIRKREVSG